MSRNMTEEEFAALMAKRMTAAASFIPGQTKSKAVRESRRNKYGAEKTEVDGMVFDSKSEAKRYLQLKAMQCAGEISDLKTQVSFDLVPEQNVNGRKERPVRYLADFSYVRDGKTVIEDVKSSPTKTKEFVIKRKLVLWLHGVAVQEVLMK